MTDTSPLPPSTPNPNTSVLIYTLLRAAVTVAGAFGIGVGGMTDSTLLAVSGAVATLIGVGSELWEKWLAARGAHAAAVTSAATGTPVRP